MNSKRIGRGYHENLRYMSTIYLSFVNLIIKLFVI